MTSKPVKPPQNSYLAAARRLLLGVVLIMIAGAILLYSDRGRRKTSLPAQTGPATAAAPAKIPHVALLQHASQPILEEGVKGILEGLAANGFRDGDNMILQRFNAEGDGPTSNQIAARITDGSFDLILTVSTLSLQAVANANKSGRTPHIFALVTDPSVTGVGVGAKENPLDHPAHLTGIGTLQPVEKAANIARQINPALKSIGVPWNAAEANSEMQMKLLRPVCEKLGIKLEEASASNASEVQQSTAALVSRGVDAIFIIGDVTVLAAADAVIAEGKKARIPVFTVIPPNAKKGALFDVGANYSAVGHREGEIAASVLKGKKPAEIPVERYVPEKLMINTTVLAGLKDTWKVPDDLLAAADLVIDDKGEHVKAAPAAPAAVAQSAAAQPTKKWRINFIGYVQTVDAEEAEHGVRDGLKESGLVEGRDYEIRSSNAQGDMATLSSLVDGAVTDQSDLIVTFSTPTLQAALARAKNVPVVFTYIASPFMAGAGKTDNDHLPNVTGFYSTGAYEQMIALVRECLPKAKRIGTLFVPAEVNTVFFRDKVAEAAQRGGMELISHAVNTSSEVPDGAIALCSEHLDAVCQGAGNLAATSFVSIARAAQQARLPLFGFMTAQAQQGAAVVVARDYYTDGRGAGLMAARIMRGDNPGAIPFKTSTKTRLIVNLDGARACGFKVPDQVIKRADEVMGK